MNTIVQIKTILQKAKTIPDEHLSRFFKTGPNTYGEHDRFIGVRVPDIRNIARDFFHLTLDQITILLTSPFNEERLLALIILVTQYQKSEEDHKEIIYQFYLNNMRYVNNWNLVDSSAHFIIGAHLLKKDKDILITLAHSKNMWERRISIVATWYFIRHQELSWTMKIAQLLLKDTHDLIHKAVGWMLREAGKKDKNALIEFLNNYKNSMPRTMLRYAIEKFNEEEKKTFLST
ncbi:MAG: DNA alkylation repair enzyme [bacterium ADurb.BinA186]|nr:MAG: DNA alkylation repair enzyme [bacterium ADurb.BinA186]